MSNQIDWNDLLELSDIYGVSGMEYRVVKYLQEKINLPLEQDGIGSALFTQKGNGLSIMVATHMDEVGFYVKKIDEDGYLFLQPVGGIWPHVIMNQKVVVINDHDEEFYGIIGSKAMHGMTMEEKSKTIPIDRVYVDMGVSSKNEILDRGIKEGDMVAFVSKSRIMNDKNYICGKAFDDRASVAVGMWLMNSLINKPTDNEVTLAATVQEEVGLRGARTTADLVYPNLAIVIDTTVAGDTPEDHNIIRLGGGVTISVIDSMTILNRGLLNYLEGICRTNNIQYQLGCFLDGGTDAGNIHKSREGIPSIILSIPMRYMHTHRGVVHKFDIRETLRLVEYIVRDLTVEKYRKILSENYNYRE